VFRHALDILGNDEAEVSHGDAHNRANLVAAVVLQVRHIHDYLEASDIGVASLHPRGLPINYLEKMIGSADMMEARRYISSHC
jgi:hypothetical protein